VIVNNILVEQLFIVDENVIATLPMAIPETIPEDKPMKAIVGSLLVHIPLPAASVRVVEVPTQVPVPPEITLNGFTETVVVDMQPVGSE